MTSYRLKEEKNLSQFYKNQALAIFVAMLLVTSAGASLALIPATSAHNPGYQIPTHAFIEVNPNPTGVGQTVNVFMWLDQIFGVGYDTTSYAMLTNNYRFHNYNLTVIDPNGAVSTTIYSVISDPTSDQLTTYTPTIAGTYQFIFSFPGQAYNQFPGAYNPNSVLVNDTYLPSMASTNLTVLSTPIPTQAGSTPLPTNYWTRPIYGEGTDWWTISSNWLGAGSPVISATGSGDITAFSTGPPSQSWGSVMQRYPGDAIGPLTGHVMWTQPLQFGGIVGGNQYPTQGIGYFEGSAYNQRFTNPIIISGVLYYTAPVSFTGTAAGPTVAVDLRTGQVLWSRTDVPALSFGYIYDLYDPNQHGVWPPILFTANFARAFDAYTGDPLFNVTGVPSGYEALGPNGEHLRYVFTNCGTAANPQWYLAEWNSSRLWDTYANPWTGAADNSPTLYNMSTVVTGGIAQEPTIPFPMTGTNVAGAGGINYNSITSAVVNGNVPLNATTAGTISTYDWNVSVPWLNVMGNQTVSILTNGTVYQGYTTTGNPDASNPTTTLAAFYNGILLLLNGTQPAAPGSFAPNGGQGSWTPYTYTEINVNASTPATLGNVIWTKTLQPPAGNITVYYAGADPTTNVFIESQKETLSWVGYSLTTGNQIWGPTKPQANFDYYGQPGPAQLCAQFAYGNFYVSSFSGILYCYDAKTGNLLWTYGNGGSGNSTYAGLTTPYGDYPTFINAVGNGVIYLMSTEHTITDPIYKGALARAVNATTGQEIWTLSDYTGEFVAMSSAIADGYEVFFNGYDNQIYSVGRGPSQTTVAAPNAGITIGSSVVLNGKVTDISAGTKQSAQASVFPNGVPVASDASMKDWMGYVYQQKPLPTNFTGVTVDVYVLDSNGNHRLIGSTTTDSSGMYTLTWVPDIPGNYTVYANFAGTNGYWPSSAETSFSVDQAAAHPTVAPTPTQNYVSNSDFLAAVAAIIVVIIIGFVASILLLRKRP
jgi:hypothetical protein